MEEPNDTETLVERIRADRTDLNASFAGLTDVQLAQPGAAGHWAVKDILVHVAFWEAQTLAKLQGAITAHDQLGGEDNAFKIDEVNDGVYEERRDQSAAEAKAAFAASGSRLLTSIARLSPDEVQAQRDFIAENTYRHYPEHAAQIRAWQEREQIG